MKIINKMDKDHRMLDGTEFYEKEEDRKKLWE